jgi:photosystem II stability/assembly factor-like uncharacterized protein
MRQLLIALLALFMFAGAAGAGQGTWEMLTAEPNAFSSGFLSMSAVDQNTFFTVGIHQFSAYGAVWAWRSTDGGYTLDPIFVFEGSGEDCEMLKFFTFMIDGDWYDLDHGVVVGMTVPDACMEQYEFPACMFICMFQMKPYVWTVADGGETFVQHDAGGNLSKSFYDLKIVNETIYACGTAGMFRKSTDFGETWVDLPPPIAGPNASMDDMWWLDEEVGFVAASVYEESAKGEPRDYDELIARYYDLRQVYEYRNNPARRFALDEQGYRPNGGWAGAAGVYKTLDGGHTWEKIWEDPQYSAYKVQFLDEMNGMILTNEWSNDRVEESVYVTHDGGATWTQGAVPASGPNNSLVLLTDMRMLTPSLGYMGTAYQTVFGASSMMWVTLDGGATWTVDTLGVDPGYPGLAAGYGFNALDFADNTRGWAAGMNLSIARYTGTNAPPVADAGPDQTTVTGATVQLDGSGSSDPDGDWLLYQWTLVEGPADLTFDNPLIVNPAFVPTVAGLYTIQLQVSDIEFQATDTVAITVEQGPPPDDDTGGDDDDTAADDDDDGAPGADDDDDVGGCGC